MAYQHRGGPRGDRTTGLTSDHRGSLTTDTDPRVDGGRSYDPLVPIGMYERKKEYVYFLSE